MHRLLEVSLQNLVDEGFVLQNLLGHVRSRFIRGRHFPFPPRLQTSADVTVLDDHAHCLPLALSRLVGGAIIDRFSIFFFFLLLVRESN